MVCTDAAAEGLNLQTADLLINFDLPWNPMKVEQRIGRIDRIGQDHEKIYVLNLCYVGSAEEIVYGRLLRRLADVGAIVGTQQISLLPVTREDFQELVEHKLSETVLERRAKERIEISKRQTMSREIRAQDLFHIYARLSHAPEPPVSLDSIWEALSQSKYLQDLGCRIFIDLGKKTIIIQNILGVADGAGLTASRETYEYGLEGFDGPLHFASYGDPVFEAVVEQILRFEPPRCVKKIQVSGPGDIGHWVSYVVSGFDEDGNRTMQVSSLNGLANIRIDEAGVIDDAEYDYLLNKFQTEVAQDFRHIQLADQIQSLNERRGLGQLLLNYVIIESILRERKEMEECDHYFWTEARALDAVITENESISIPDISPQSGQKLHGSLFEIHMSATGGPARINAPQFLLRCALDSVYRLASRRSRVRRAELLTNDVLTMIERETLRL